MDGSSLSLLKHVNAAVSDVMAFLDFFVDLTFSASNFLFSSLYKGDKILNLKNTDKK